MNDDDVFDILFVDRVAQQADLPEVAFWRFRPRGWEVEFEDQKDENPDGITV